MKLERWLIVAVVTMGMLSVRCEKEPQNAITDARSALEKAEKAGAAQWAPAQMKRGNNLLDSALQAVAVEKKKLPFLRDYRKINEMLEMAGEAGFYAQGVTLTGMERMRARAREQLDQVELVVDSIDRVLKATATPATSVALVRQSLDSIRIAREEASTMLTSGDLFLANEKTKWVSAKIEEVVQRATRLTTASDKSVGKQ